LLDRIDIHVEVPPLGFESLMGNGHELTSAELRECVLAARERQLARNGSSTSNARLTPRDIQQRCALDRRGTQLLRAALERLGLSARGVHRVLRVARTIADLDGCLTIADAHVAEAIQYRALDKGPDQDR
jgi:magnesium chelatase family protein